MKKTLFLLVVGGACSIAQAASVFVDVYKDGTGRDGMNQYTSNAAAVLPLQGTSGSATPYTLRIVKSHGNFFNTAPVTITSGEDDPAYDAYYQNRAAMTDLVSTLGSFAYGALSSCMVPGAGGSSTPFFTNGKLTLVKWTGKETADTLAFRIGGQKAGGAAMAFSGVPEPAAAAMGLLGADRNDGAPPQTVIPRAFRRPLPFFWMMSRYGGMRLICRIFPRPGGGEDPSRTEGKIMRTGVQSMPVSSDQFPPFSWPGGAVSPWIWECPCAGGC